MAFVITMPKFGLTMTEGTVTHWCKSVGDRVESGEVLYEVQTDKITNEVEALQTGVLRHIFAPVGTLAEVGKPLAIIADEQEDIAEHLGSQASSDVAVAQGCSPLENQEHHAEEEALATAMITDGCIRATPLARKLGREQGISLQELIASGPRGIVVSRDVVKQVSKQPAISPLAKKFAEEHGVKWEEIEQRNRIMLTDVIAEQLKASLPTDALLDPDKSAGPVTKRMAGARKVIAERMTQSWQQIPHVTITREVDVTYLLSAHTILSADAAKNGTKITLTHFLIKIVASALQNHPALNAWCQGNEITYHQEVNMGVAVSVQDGLIVPVIPRACKKDILEIAEALNDLTVRAKEQRLTVDEMRGGTFTISNLGMMDVDGFTPIINPPETGILGIGRIVEKPVFMGEQIVRRSMMTLSLSFDHRALDGAEAAKFLQSIVYYIEEPLRLLMKGSR